MAFPRNSLSAFVSYASRSFLDCKMTGRKVHLVIGNESADLDSSTCSLLYAYVRSLSPPESAYSPLYIPILNIPNSGLRLRPEFAATCRQAGVETNRLLTLDDLPLNICRLTNIRWILVDHNKLTGRLAGVPTAQIAGVIDHHEEEHFVPSETDPEPRIIENAGSCTSLVTRYCRPSWDAISSASLSTGAAHGQGESAINDSAFTQVWDAKIAKMALATILIDTVNLTAVDKVMPVDNEAVEYLEAKIMMAPKEAKAWDREAFFVEINEAKSDIAGLTLDEILIKDYKQWTENGMNIGISSVVKDLEFLVSKAKQDDKTSSEKDIALVSMLNGFMEQHDLTLFAIMTASKSASGDFQRQLFLQVRPEAQEILTAFLKRAQHELKLEDLRLQDMDTQSAPASDGIWRHAWWQRDLSKSRKQVGPILRQAMRA